MIPRDRYVQTLLFGKPDRIPLRPGGPRESTLAAWRSQGLPEGVNYYDALLELLDIEPDDTGPRVSLGVDFKMIPQFEEKVLQHKPGNPGSYIVQDWMGAITEISDRYDYTYIRSAKDFVTRKWHRFPVQTREDWLEMRKRYDPSAPGRYPADFAARCQALRDRSYPLAFSINGPFWQLREWLGLETLCMTMLDDPAWIEEMIEFWTEFVLATMQPILEHVQVDAVHLSEDMAYKIHSMISPRMARHFLLPTYRRWSDRIRASGCPIISMDSDGHIGKLIPVWIDGGINVCEPIEVAAGNDIVEYRRTFGRTMAFTGGIDKRAIARGGAEMVEEVLRVVPPLLEEGGFIPGCDHGVPSDISWPNYVEYSRLLARLTGWLD
ncbi:MAG: hypothetical protein HYY04_14325 [Chloroflexi bacterium]|nr:hypothetical protein [Chloroflexota bacterium]